MVKRRLLEVVIDDLMSETDELSTMKSHHFNTSVIYLAPTCVLSPGGLYTKAQCAWRPTQSAVPYHLSPRVRCLYLPVSPNKVGVAKSFVIICSSFVDIVRNILSLYLVWWQR